MPGTFVCQQNVRPSVTIQHIAARYIKNQSNCSCIEIFQPCFINQDNKLEGTKVKFVCKRVVFLFYNKLYLFYIKNKLFYLFYINFIAVCLF